MHYYFAYLDGDLNKERELDLLKKTSYGLVSIFSVKQQRFYRVYYCTKRETTCLTPNWRRGVPWFDLKVNQSSINFFRNKNNEFSQIKRVRLKDFQKIYFALKNKVFTSKRQALIEVNDENLKVFEKQKLTILYNIYEVFQSSIRKKSLIKHFYRAYNDWIKNNNSKAWDRFRQKIKEKINNFEDLKLELNLFQYMQWVTQDLELVYSIYYAFFLDDYFILKDTINFLEPRIKRNILLGMPRLHGKHNSLQETQHKFKSQTKIKRILVISSLETNLRTMEKNLSKWDKLERTSLTHLSANFTKNQMNDVLHQFLDLRNVQMLIYKGHSKVINGKIHWKLLDGYFEVPRFERSHYIHLACLEKEENQKQFIKQLPAKFQILPVGEIPDYDYSTLFHTLAEYWQQGKSFEMSWFEYLHKDKAQTKVDKFCKSFFHLIRG